MVGTQLPVAGLLHAGFVKFSTPEKICGDRHENHKISGCVNCGAPLTDHSRRYYERYQRLIAERRMCGPTSGRRTSGGLHMTYAVRAAALVRQSAAWQSIQWPIGGADTDLSGLVAGKSVTARAEAAGANDVVMSHI